MPATLTPQTFVDKWRDATALKERAAAQEHFIDLCRMVGHPTPAEDDPAGVRFTFEAGANKLGGGQGWADVWKMNYFAWEYKGKHANLDKAYQQLQQYRESLQNPPLLVVSDLERIVIHTNFTNTVKRVIELDLPPLLTSAGIRTLRALFYEPESFRASQSAEQVTRAAATEFARLAEHLRKWGHEPERIARFLIRLLFALFAEDIDLLPKGLFTRLIDAGRGNPPRFNQQVRELFGAMATGNWFGEHPVLHFNGGLFDNDSAIELDREGVVILHQVAALDWSSIEPSILGTLFERSLDPSKRSQLGAHYTSREDILLLVEPVLMAPLRREWEAAKVAVTEMAERRDQATTAGTRTRYHNELRATIQTFFDKIAATRVLDPACGSGNFLYVALRQLLDLEKEVSQFAMTMNLPGLFPQSSPTQLYGIELNEYAHELAQATVWIGYIQWMHENGYGVPSQPILKRLDNIRQMDAILAFDADGNPVEPAWPEAEVIVGNPPFLGGNRVRQEMGNKYVDALFQLYEGRIPAFADLVCYWFEKAREQISSKVTERVGLLSTNSIRGHANRQVLERIKQSGDIFMAWDDRSWVLEGAAVRVSMIGFDNGTEMIRHLNDQPVQIINSDLTASLDLTGAVRLQENLRICFIGTKKAGAFDIEKAIAVSMLNAPVNVNGRPNSDVVLPWLNGQMLVQKMPSRWIIYFAEMPIDQAALYELPFEYVRTHVFEDRQVNNEERARVKWWQHRRPAIDMKNAIDKLGRYIATPRVAKHRLFAWVSSTTVPDDRIYIFAREDDYFFGILHSSFHEKWSLRKGSWMGKGNDPVYTPTSTFETFPFPWPPGQEPVDDPRVQAIALAAQELNAKREAWLNPPGMDAAELKRRTLTNLYNQRPTWLDLAHKRLDDAVAAAYAWPTGLADEEILARLLALNLARAGRETPTG